MAKVEIKEMHRTIGDLSKQPANIPTGVWKLRAIKISSKDVTKTNRDGEEYETKEHTLSMEPLEPTASVNPDEVNELDEKTGKPVYEGKRLFLRYVDAFRSDLTQLGAALSAMGFDEKEDFDAIVASNAVRGKIAFGEVFNRTYKRNDGSDGVEQKVRSWAGGEAGSGFAL
jgi:hypothetical protein